MAHYSPDRYIKTDFTSRDKSKLPNSFNENLSKERAVDDDVCEGKDASVLQKYIDRFRYCEPESRSERQTADATEFWWKQVRSSIDSINEQIDECARKRQQMKERRIKAPIPKPDFSPPRHHELSHTSRLQPLEKNSIEDLQSRADEILERNNKTRDANTKVSTPKIDLNELSEKRVHHMTGLYDHSEKSRYETPELDDHQNMDAKDILTQWRLRRKMELARMHQDPLSKANSFYKVATDKKNTVENTRMTAACKMKDEVSYCTEDSFPAEHKVVRMMDAQTQASPKLHAGQISFTASRDSRCGPDHKSGSDSFMVTSLEDLDSVNRGRRRRIKRNKKKKYPDESDPSLTTKNSKGVYNMAAEEGNPRKLVNHLDRDLWSVGRGRSVDIQSSTDFGSLSISARESRELRTPVRSTITQAISSHLFDSANLRSSADSDSFFGSKPAGRVVVSEECRPDQLQLTDVSEGTNKSSITNDKSTKEKPPSCQTSNEMNNNSQDSQLVPNLEPTEDPESQNIVRDSNEEPNKDNDTAVCDEENALDEAMLQELLSCESDNEFSEDSVLIDLRRRRLACIQKIRRLNSLIESRQIFSET